MKNIAIKQSKPISQFLASFISVGLFVYFFYHLSHGDRGYFAWKGVEERLQSSQTAYDQAVLEREALENKVKLLRPDSIDIDMLDERARTVLGLMKPSEVIIQDDQL